MKTKLLFYTLTIYLTLTTGVMAQSMQNHMVQALHNDQFHRNELNQLKQNQKPNSDLIKQLENSQYMLDQENQTLLATMIDQLGHWPGINDVGENAAKVGLILFKRSDLKQQSNYLPLILTEVTKDNIPANWYAELYDHHLMTSNRPQRYGHLMVKSTKDNQPMIYPFSSIQKVNQNRAELGLNSLQEMLADKNWLLRSFDPKTNDYDLIPAQKVMHIAELAFSCLDREYPNSIKHVMNHDKDAAPPSSLYPTFYGCFDWHSSVHGHWLLAKAAKTFPHHAKTKEFIDLLDHHLTAENLTAELEYFRQAGRNGFERPYGLAWFLQLYTELHNWKQPKAQQWVKNLTPLKDHIVQQLSSWIPKLAYPIRSGEHSQTAFAFGLAHDYAKKTSDKEFLVLLNTHIKRLYENDLKCPINYEPSGHDFLSPCLAEADLLRRVFSKERYNKWLKRFLPGIKKATKWLPLARVTDRVDGKLAHLDGLNLARAWMLEGIASALPEKDKRRSVLLDLATKHARSGLTAVSDEHYAGGHWLGSFAIYYLTQSGIH